MSHHQKNNAPAAAGAEAGADGAAAAPNAPVVTNVQAAPTAPTAQVAPPQEQAPAHAAHSDLDSPAASGSIASKQQLGKGKKAAHRAARAAAAGEMVELGAPSPRLWKDSILPTGPTTAAGMGFFLTTSNNGAQDITMPPTAVAEAGRGSVSVAPRAPAATAGMATTCGSLGAGTRGAMETSMPARTAWTARTSAAVGVKAGGTGVEATSGLPRGFSARGTLPTGTTCGSFGVGARRTIPPPRSARTLSTARASAAVGAATATCGSFGVGARATIPSPRSARTLSIAGASAAVAASTATWGSFGVGARATIPPSRSARTLSTARASAAVAAAMAGGEGTSRFPGGLSALDTHPARPEGGGRVLSDLAAARQDQPSPEIPEILLLALASEGGGNREAAGGRVGLELNDDRDARGEGQADGIGGGGRTGRKIDELPAFPSSRRLLLVDGENGGYKVTEKVNSTGDKLVLLMQQTQGLQALVVGVEFSTLRLSVSFERSDHARLLVGNLLYLQALDYKIISSNSAPHTMGYVSAIPAPSMVSPGPFKDAGLQCSDLIYLVNGDHLGPDGAERWWRQPAATGARAVSGSGSGSGSGGEGGDSSAMARSRFGGGKRRSGRFMLPKNVELGILRATGETSKTTKRPSSADVWKASTRLVLLQDHKAMVKYSSLSQRLDMDCAQLSTPMAQRFDSALAEDVSSLTDVAVQIKEKTLRAMEGLDKARLQHGLARLQHAVAAGPGTLPNKSIEGGSSSTAPAAPRAPDARPAAELAPAAADGAAAASGGGSGVSSTSKSNNDRPGRMSVSAALQQGKHSRVPRNWTVEQAREGKIHTKSPRQHDDPKVKARGRDNADVSAMQGVGEPSRGMVVWAKRGGELWPSLVVDSLPQARCIIRYLAIPEKRQGSAPVVVFKQVGASSLQKFPGGLSLSALRERLEPLGAGATRQAKDMHILKELYLPANKKCKRVQLAIDHAVGLCVLFLWNGSAAMANVIKSSSVSQIFPLKKKRPTEKQKRLDSFLEWSDQWVSPVETKDSYARFRTLMNDTQTDPVARGLKVANHEVEQWITSTKSEEGSSSTPT